MRQKLPSNLFGMKMGKNLTGTFDCLSKNVKNVILTYNSTIFKEIDKKLQNNLLSRNIVNILLVIRQ